MFYGYRRLPTPHRRKNKCEDGHKRAAGLQRVVSALRKIRVRSRLALGTGFLHKLPTKKKVC